ncbi:DNA topoisomerase IV subunit A [Mycoplasma marinum]|uniref:DNA topoisomerase (ATP-hydrolyzing) n=1 Tax=Mycoplasma marinum TaxID=1937190 RepID=A0A4R0XST7_9MOLU|nr:DNA topoisomerase IV subunit A [Mycoplasma marinum]TCG10787.1 DNA topoisomerase IV subunit A [Mycoplasma marinum]
MSKNTNEQLLKQSLDQIMSDRFGRYSKYIIQDRALPDARDGLKPVQRRILFAMHELGLTHNKPYKKSARVVGEVIGKYHPHGDSSIYEALVRMTQNWKMNMPLISMHGNNGSIDDDPAAAMRYTEARLEKLTELMLRGIKKETVSFAPNFDDSESEPTVLPAGFPNLLINGAKGIAAGYATEMPPHNLGEILDAVIATIKSPNIRLETLMNYVKGPDFPTGGVVQGLEGIYSAFERGKGRIIIRSKVSIDDSKKNHSITISEIPYGVIKSRLVRDIDEIRFNKSIHGIKEVRDETDRNGTSIYIELDPNTNAKLVLNYLYSKTDLQVYYNYNNIAIKDRAPRLLSLKELIDAFINHQKGVHKNQINFELDKDKIRHEIVSGLVRVSAMVDEVIEVIRKASGSKAGVVKALIENFEFTQLQATAIAELRLYRLSSTDQFVYIQEKEELEARIARYNQLLNEEQQFNSYLIDFFKTIKKDFAIPRKTEIVNEIEKIDINVADLIKHEDVYIGVSRQGYIKSFSNRIYESNKFEQYGLKEADSLVFLSKINTSNKLLVFTDAGQYIFIPCHKISEDKFKAVGKHINDYASINPDHRIVSVIAVNDFSLNAFVTLATKKGKVKRVSLKDFEVSRFSRALTAIRLAQTDKMIGARVSGGDKQLIIVTSNTKAVKYSESTVSIQGTKSAGVIGISTNDNYVTAFTLANQDETIGMLSDRGGLKRIRVQSIEPSSRTTKGRTLFREIKSKPHLIEDMNVVQSSTKAYFMNLDGMVDLIEMKTIDKSNAEAGLSLGINKRVRSAKLLVPQIINKDSPLIQVSEVSEEDSFKKAQEKIESVSQLSIDDILSDI